MSADIPGGLRDMWHEVPVGAAPVDVIERAGQQARVTGHKRRLMIVSAVAGVVAVALVAVGLAEFHGRSDVHTKATGPPPTMAGKQFVGIRGVVTAVPDTWVIQQPVCVRPTTAFVFFTSTAMYSCPDLPPQDDGPPVAALEIGSLSSSTVSLETLTNQRNQGGLDVRYGDRTCTASVCRQTFAVPSDDAVFIATIPVDSADTQLSEIGSAITQLPDEYTTVPFIEPGTAVERAEQTLTNDGLLVATSGDVSTDQLVLDISPNPGTVIRIGDTVTLDLSAN